MAKWSSPSFIESFHYIFINIEFIHTDLEQGSGNDFLSVGSLYL